jgi:hypothetical protein
MPGQVGILNVGAGDTKLVFDSSVPEEMARSAAVVEDMIRRGFVLLIKVGRDERGPTYRRAHGFDPKTAEYIIAGPPPPELAATAAPLPRTPEVLVEHPKPAPRRRQGRKAQGETRVKASSADAVAVPRTAGG